MYVHFSHIILLEPLSREFIGSEAHGDRSLSEVIAMPLISILGLFRNDRELILKWNYMRGSMAVPSLSG